MTYPFKQALALFKANCTLATRLSRIAQASGREWVNASAGSMTRLTAREPVVTSPTVEEKPAPPGQDGAARVASSMSETFEDAGAALAEWQSSCFSALFGQLEDGPGDFVRYNAWCWRPSTAGKNDGEDAKRTEA